MMYPPSAEEKWLTELKRALTLGGSSAVFGALVLVVPYGIVFTVLKVAAALFAPFMLWRLLQCRRYGWVIAFMVAVGAPFLYGLLAQHDGVPSFLLSVLPLVMFYGYTWLLRHRVEEWIEDLRWKRAPSAPI